MCKSCFFYFSFFFLSGFANKSINYSLYNSKKLVRTRYFFVFAAPSIALKIYFIDLGTIPLVS